MRSTHKKYHFTHFIWRECGSRKRVHTAGGNVNSTPTSEKNLALSHVAEHSQCPMRHDQEHSQQIQKQRKCTLTTE